MANRSGKSLAISRVCVPMDPVDPTMHRRAGFRGGSASMRVLGSMGMRVRRGFPGAGSGGAAARNETNRTGRHIKAPVRSCPRLR